MKGLVHECVHLLEWKVVVGYMGEGTPLEEKLLLEVLPLQEKSFRTLENPKYFSNT